MAYSDQDILGKIGDLLVEINEHYAGLDKKNLASKKADILLLAAQAKYLAAHIEALASLQTQPTHLLASASAGVVQEEEKTFTPAIEHDEHEADEQPVEEEIQEVEAVEPETERKPFVEEYDEEEPESTTYAEESNEENREIIEDEEEELVEDPKEAEDREEEKEEAEPVEEVSDFKNFNISSNPVHTASSGYTSVASADEAEEDKKNVEEQNREEVKADAEPTVNEVVIEEKEIEIEEDKPEEVVSLNDLAKQAEVKPSRPLTLNELIQQQKKAGLTNANQFNTSQDKSSDRIADLKVAVSLNDKLLFIKDLFNGYSLAYSEAIELLNRFDNFAEADAFLQSNYSLKNNWASKPQTVDKLYAILRKKYI